MDFKVGDEIWWFKIRTNASSGFSLGYSNHLTPDQIELVHDVVTDVQDGTLICWHGSHSPKDIWGKSRQEAWARLKTETEKWGPVE
jgi:hypothetical protein